MPSWIPKQLTRHSFAVQESDELFSGAPSGVRADGLSRASVARTYPRRISRRGPLATISRHPRGRTGLASPSNYRNAEFKRIRRENGRVWSAFHRFNIAMRSTVASTL